MAKKKKKGGTSNSSSEVTPTPTKLQQVNEIDSPQDSGGMVYECLELTVKRPTSKTRTTKFGPDATPKISIHQSDAKKLGVQSKEEVLVCFKGQDSYSGVIAGVLVCQVDTLDPTHRSPQSNAKVHNAISPGSCHIHPSYELDAILEVDEEQPSSDTPLNATEVSNPSRFETPPAPSNYMQSSPKSRFSFADGASNDSYTSPYLSTPPTKGQRATAKSSVSSWVIPLSSPLGEDAATILCQTAKHLCIQVEESLIERVASGHKQILTRLFIAQYTGRYIHESEKLTISFQGKSLDIQVYSVSGESDTNQREDALIELEMESLTLDDGDNDNIGKNLWKFIRAALDEPSKARSVLLYKIHNDTEVTIVSSKTSPDGRQGHDALDSKEIPRVVVAGLTSTLERLRSLILTPVSRPEIFLGGSLRAPRGVLLHGSSGVGKTCLVRQLASDFQREEAVNMRVEFVNCASLQTHRALVGEAERRLSQIFERASLPLAPQKHGQRKSGTLLIFDDIHLICPKRSGYDPGSDRLVSTLLGLLDGIGSCSQQATSLEGAISSSIVILAVTNNPSILDPALRRPGRLDFEIEVPIPDGAMTRAEILKYHLENLEESFFVPELTEDQLLSLGKLAKGFNGADCMLAVKEALRVALLRRQSRSAPDTSAVQLTLSDIQHAIRNTTPSAIKSITVEIPKVHWSSIGGMEIVKKQLREAVELPESHGHLFQQLKIPLPRGILLYGPPGCSKTLMARALATEGQMNFLAVKGPELLSKWLGESERALASLFSRARMASPSIIFFDEVDSIGGKRDSAGVASGGGRLLSQLLTELDGVNHAGGAIIGNSPTKSPRVVVVGATNRPDLLDAALMRPGRIDRKIYVGVPDLQSRTQIFNIGLQDKACASNVDVAELAREEISGGFSGAELIAACRDAALLALEEDNSDATCYGPEIQMSHLLKAIGSMQRQISPEMIQFYESFRRNQDSQI